MLSYFAAATVLKKRKADVDNAVFHLHYRVTFLIFIISSGLVTAKEFIGTPIQCLANGISGNALNTYCYIMGTFSVEKHWNMPLGNGYASEFGNDGIAYPGVGPYEKNEEKVVYHSYYQWVPMMLLLQASMFYVPRYLWKCMDGGLFRSILGGLNTKILDRVPNKEAHKVMLKYMMDHLNSHRLWAIR